MAAPYTEVTVVNYNSNPPSDDGAQTASNRVQWSTQKTKLADPLKVAIDTIDDNITAAFGKIIGGAGVTGASTNYTVLAIDQGKLVKVTASSVTITTPDATIVTAPFVFNVVNNSSGSITILGNGTQTIDGVLSFTMPAGNGATFYTDGTNWFTAGQNFTRSFSPPSSYKNLSVKVASNTTVTVAADFVTTTNGSLFLTTAVSATIDLGSNGAVNKLDAGTVAIDTWYAIWVIAKADGTTGCLASASFSAPTLPTDYTFKARIGAVQTIHASATLYGTWQLGRRAQYIVGLAQTAVIPLIASGVIGTYSGASPTLAATSVARFVPPTASSINLTVTSAWKNGTVSNVLVAPSTAYGGTNNGPFGSLGNFYPSVTQSGNTAHAISFLLEDVTIGVASDNAGGAVGCFGWEDNL